MKVSENSLREKILCVAEHLFAERGFTETSVREITRRANCNLSAVNYYFHGKENLYVEIFRCYMSNTGHQEIPSIATIGSDKGGQVKVEQLIRTFCRAFLESFLKRDSGEILPKLVMRERQDPHLPKHISVEQLAQPARSAMKEALIRACPGLDDLAADLCVQSIIGQLHHLTLARAMFKGPEHRSMPVTDLPARIEHIVIFSAAGVRQYVNTKATLSAKR